jgi:hypothetical protein
MLVRKGCQDYLPHHGAMQQGCCRVTSSSYTANFTVLQSHLSIQVQQLRQCLQDNIPVASCQACRVALQADAPEAREMLQLSQHCWQVRYVVV